MNCTCHQRPPWHGEEPNVVKQLVCKVFTSWFDLCCMYMLLFRFDASPKKLFVSCHYDVPFVCLVAMILMLNTANIQYFWAFLDIPIKYSWKLIISFLKYYTLHKTHFALQDWQPYFFSWLLLPGLWFIFQRLTWDLSDTYTIWKF